MTDEFDLVVIGSGPAGDKGASQAAYFGHSVAVVERRSDVGGSAIAVSGVPVKALRDTAVYLTGWSRRDVYGVGISLAPDLVMNRLRARITDVVTTMQNAVAANFERHGVVLLHGAARLGPELAVVVTDDDGNERTLRAKRILLATGSRPHHPRDVPFDDPDVYDSETVLSIERLPDHLVVVGGGAVGAEYASIFAHLGVRVTLVSPARVCCRCSTTRSPTPSPTACVPRARGSCSTVRSTRSNATMRGLLYAVGRETLHPEVLLHAGGRSGNVEGLGLDNVGVEADERGRVRVDENFRTTAPGIYAAGDVTGPPGLASVAMEGARIAMCRAFDIPFKEALDPVIPTGIYTLPEVSMVGLTEDAARAAGEDVETGRAFFTANARAMIAGSTEGLVKLVFRASDRVLVGAHILGEEATELIHVAQALLHRGGVIDEFIDTTFNFPTRADAYKYAAYDGLQRLQARGAAS